MTDYLQSEKLTQAIAIAGLPDTITFDDGFYFENLCGQLGATDQQAADLLAMHFIRWLNEKYDQVITSHVTTTVLGDPNEYLVQVRTGRISKEYAASTLLEALTLAVIGAKQ